MNQTISSSLLSSADLQASAAKAVKRQRSLLIDVVRGFAITLVALGHTEQGVGHRGWWGHSIVGLRISVVIYAFHMPAFFFISGVFLAASLDKRGYRRFTLDKVRSILWPYVLFSVLAVAGDVLFAQYTVVKTPSLHTFLVALITGAASWFLPTIFFVVMLGALGRRLPAPLFLLLATAVSLWYPSTGIAFATRGLRFLPFLVLGMWVGRRYEQIESLPRLMAAFLGALLLLLIIGITGTSFTDGDWKFLPFGVLGILMLLLFARALAHTQPARTLSWIGEASFGIFLLAAYPQGGGRELLFRLGHITNPYLQTVVPTILAVVFPALLYRYRVRLHIAWMFHFPY